MTWEEFWEINVGKEWKDSFPFINFNNIITYLEDKEFYPAKENVFKAFRLTPPSELKVIILGLDPYTDRDRATGLAFANSNEDNRSASPSLKVIWNCVEREFHNGLVLDFDFSLESWAKQGVLLLNSALTVVPGKTGSHVLLWRDFTSSLLTHISSAYPDTIFILWGKNAEEFEKFISGNVLKYVHPAYSIYSHTHWNCKNFKEANEILISQQKSPIQW